MSGGHWGYKQFEIEHLGSLVAALVSFAAAAHHELDYGLEGDSCLMCARLRVGAALEALFDAFFVDGDMAAVDEAMTDRSRPDTQCYRHQMNPSGPEDEKPKTRVTACPLCLHPFVSGSYAWEHFGLVFHRDCLMRLRGFGLHLEQGHPPIEGRVIAV